jgi:hypothetical protein
MDYNAAYMFQPIGKKVPKFSLRHQIRQRFCIVSLATERSLILQAEINGRVKLIKIT